MTKVWVNYVTFAGPPSEPAGVYVERGSDTNDTVRLIWTWNPIANHGFPVVFFEVDAITSYSKDWTVIATGLC